MQVIDGTIKRNNVTLKGKRKRNSERKLPAHPIMFYWVQKEHFKEAHG